ncbi:MAG: ABC transporter ATP-binding protein [Lautropia sp.]|nr:MAG: ABC transporter ATP-binding protein [Pseudomonadota bacterium]MBC6958932.1 ABC transporter ATP-binding protein [Lautropia sp.]MCL4701080.1 ABC transporter ATP-binding protein [Burkholderiaceae bacterium]MDL1908669.1 ABC transporter ATP-binding protein [Betaproteobacteria bacterium PRO1]RIK90463.1 MAG: ABC transporter ATP-binding protein [Burkholderiales bacterium]
MLEVDGLSSRYGRITAVDSVSLSVNDGELVALVGANGAGKSTLLRTLSGVQPAATGNVRFEGVDVTRVSPRTRVRMGIVQVPEGRQVFGPLTVEDNLRLGAYVRPATEIAGGLEKVYTLFPILASKRHDAAGTLSGGQQQMLAMGRALMTRPRLLLLDEPSMGLSPLLVSEIFATIRALKEANTTILLVDQNARAALSVADRAYVLEVGRIALSGSGAELLHNPAVQQAYLGL